MPTTKTFTFALPDDLKRGLQLLREREGIAEAEQIRRAIRLWLESKGIVEKAALRRASTRRKA